MRSALIIVATLVVIFVGFATYLWLQPGGAAAVVDGTEATLQPIMPTTNPSGDMPVGEAEGVWVNRYHPRTGELASRFRVARWEPAEDGRMLVEAPEAEFVLRDGVVRISGTRGVVVRPETPPTSNDPHDLRAGGGAAAAAGMPQRGQLFDVRIALFDSDEAIAANTPRLTVEMNNASFDNDTFRIATEGYADASGDWITGDQVPVLVRGDDFDFTGRGLVIRWNDLDQRLELLEVAHGESLVIKNPDMLPTGGELAARRGRGRHHHGRDAAPRITLAAADIGPAVVSAMLAADAAAPDEPDEPVYRATFEDALRITRGEDVVSGDLMSVDFRLGEPGDDAGDGDDATRAPTMRRARRAPTTARADEDQPEPAPQGVVVKWTGRLRVVPMLDAHGPALNPGDAAIRVAGAPVRLEQPGRHVEAGTLAYHAADGLAELTASDAVPAVTLTDAGGAVLTTRELRYQMDGDAAEMSGPGRAVIPPGDDADGDAAAGEPLSAEWSRSATVRFASVDGGKGGVGGADDADAVVIERADFVGDVRVRHPQLDLSSDELALLFDPPAEADGADAAATTRPATRPSTQPAATQVASTQPAATQPSRGDDVPPLRRAIARGDVVATVRSADGPTQTLRGNELEVETATTDAGELYPRVITARGDAVASSADGQQLTAGRITATLAPEPKSDDPPGDGTELVLRTFDAQGSVRFTGADGAFVEAEQVWADATVGRREVRLIGQPTARLSDGTNILTGPLIRYLPDAQRAEVLGAGTLHTEQAADAPGDVTGQPIDIGWSGRLEVSGASNRIEVFDGVVVTTTQEDDASRTFSTTRADRAVVELTDAAPATQPAAAEASTDATPQPAAPVADADATTQPADGADDRLVLLGGSGEGMDFLSGKEPRTVTLIDNVTTEATQAAPDGAMLQFVYLEAPRATYDAVTQDMRVPVAGRLLVRDHRPDSGSPGTTAFQWQDSLAYASADRVVTMLGDVEISHEPADADPERTFRLWTNRIRAELGVKPTEPATRPASTQPTATQPVAENEPATQPLVSEEVELERIVADGGVRVQTRDFEVDAPEVIYDPRTNELTARGTDQRPVYYDDRSGGSAGTLAAVRWNIETDEVRVDQLRAQVRP